MAKQALQFGDENTADVILYLVGSTGEEYGGNPIFCHSPVLKKSEFFETKLSERWSSDKRPCEIKLTSSHSGENYIKCIKFMYSSYYGDECYCFSSVDEALAILQVASEMMFDDCVRECMLYLDAVRWSREQNVELRALLSSLQINTLPALAARLGMNQPKSDGGYIEIFKESLQELLSTIRSGTEYESECRSTVEKHMLNYFKANASPSVKDACRYAMMKEFNVHAEIIKSKSGERDISLVLPCCNLLRLICLIRRCDRKLFKTVLTVFCEDTDLRNTITTRVVTKQSATFILHILITLFLKAMGNGETITLASIRVSFLTNWVDTMLTLMAVVGNDADGSLSFLNALEKGIVDVAETLPLVEQRLIYNTWKDALAKRSMSITSAVIWWSDKLHDAFTIDEDYSI